MEGQRDREEAIAEGSVAGKNNNTDDGATPAKGDIQSQVEDSIRLGTVSPQSEGGQNSTKNVGFRDRDKYDAPNEVTNDLTSDWRLPCVRAPKNKWFRFLNCLNTPSGSPRAVSHHMWSLF